MISPFWPQDSSFLSSTFVHFVVNCICFLCRYPAQQQFHTRKESNMTFENLGLMDSILDALHRQGYTAPTPIQAGAIPAVLQGRDVLGLA